jgi:uncharacterized protein (TIRG00374 family)
METLNTFNKTEKPVMRKKFIRRVLMILMHSLGFILLYFVIRNLDFSLMKENFSLFRTWKVIAGLAILMLVYLIKTYRWLTINRVFGVKSPYGTLLVYFLFSGLLSSITPGRLGEFSRIWFLQKEYKSGIMVSTSSVLLDRIWDVLTLSMIGGICLILYISRFSIEWYTLLLTGLIFLFALAIILFPGILFRPAIKLAGRRAIRQELEFIFRVWKENRGRLLAPGFGTSIIAFAMLAFIPVMLSVDLEAPVHYGASVTAVSISNILSFLPVTVAGFGTRELVFTMVWSAQSYPALVAVSVSFIYFITTYMGSMLFGGIVYLLWIRKFYSIREIRSRQK